MAPKLTAMLFESFGQADTTDDLWSSLKAIPSEVFEIREVSENGIDFCIFEIQFKDIF